MTTVQGYYSCDAVLNPRTHVRPFANRLNAIDAVLPTVECSELECALLAMRDAIPQLHSVTYHRLVDIFKHSFDDWLNPKFEYRRVGTKSLSATLGYSVPMIDAILDAMFSRMRDDLPELEPTGLGHGITVCTHPETPGPQLLTIVSSLLRGMPIFCKSQPAEPTFTSLYMRSLVQTEPQLSRSLLGIPWEGGTLSTKPLDQTLYGRLGARDALVFFGSPSALASIRRFTPSELPIYGYTRNMGIILIGGEMLLDSVRDDTVLKCAYAISAYNRSICASPQIVFVERSRGAAPGEFCKALSAALARIAATELPVGDLGAMYGRLANAHMAYEMLESQGLVEYFPFSDGNRLVGAVIYLPRGIPELPEGGNVRTVTVCAVGDVSEAISLLKDRVSDIHSVGMTLSSERYEPLKRRYDQLGVRVAPTEEMLNLSFRDYTLFS